MALVVPQSLKVFADQEFKDLIQDMVDEIQRVSKLAMDLERVRAMAVQASRAAGQTNVGFFKITQAQSGFVEDLMSEYDIEGACVSFNGALYRGTYFEFQTADDLNNFGVPINCVSNIFGIDIWGSLDLPNDLPDHINVEGHMPLAVGTTITAQKVAENVCYFSAGYPRVVAQCTSGFNEPEGASGFSKTPAELMDKAQDLQEQNFSTRQLFTL